MGIFAKLDRYGTDDPDFNEGFPEDRCPTCERPVIDHPCFRHRIAAAVELTPWFQLQWYLCLALIPTVPLLAGVAVGVLIGKTC